MHSRSGGGAASKSSVVSGKRGAAGATALSSKTKTSFSLPPGSWGPFRCSKESNRKSSFFRKTSPLSSWLGASGGFSAARMLSCGEDSPRRQTNGGSSSSSSSAPSRLKLTMLSKLSSGRPVGKKFSSASGSVSGLLPLARKWSLCSASVM